MSYKLTPERLAVKFHSLYEELASKHNYETKEETKKFDPESPNGKLMIATCEKIIEWQAKAYTPESMDEATQLKPPTRTDHMKHNMPIEDWLENVVDGGFIDYDGFGQLGTETHLSNLYVRPSYVDRSKGILVEASPNFMDTAFAINTEFLTKHGLTHVNWYNR